MFYVYPGLSVHFRGCFWGGFRLQALKSHGVKIKEIIFIELRVEGLGRYILLLEFRAQPVEGVWGLRVWGPWLRIWGEGW